MGNAMSDPTAFKITQVPSSILTELGLYSQFFGILNAVESLTVCIHSIGKFRCANEDYGINSEYT